MFYEIQPLEQKEKYKEMLKIIGNLSLLFSDNQSPYLSYRVHENVFCKYFCATNLAREDCSVDAIKDMIGIGLKTWVGRNDQKVAEFGKVRNHFQGLTGLTLAIKVSEYRNERIKITKNIHGINEMIYHIVKRVPGAMQILEHNFDFIDIEHIRIIKDRGNYNNTYFTDGKHTYHFSSSKNTLYMLFDKCELLDSFDVEIMKDPYTFLLESIQNYNIEKVEIEKEKICLRLYSTKGQTKYVPKKSGLNQWNGVRTSNRKRKDGTIVHTETKRDVNELYIPYPIEDRKRNINFFPPKDKIFNLHFPDGKIASAKICQEDGKAIMTNPNKVLGEWLLRKVFELPEETLVTYEMLEKFGIDSVIFTKEDDENYFIDFAEIGTYEEFYE